MVIILLVSWGNPFIVNCSAEYSIFVLKINIFPSLLSLA